MNKFRRENNYNGQPLTENRLETVTIFDKFYIFVQYMTQYRFLNNVNGYD